MKTLTSTLLAVLMLGSLVAHAAPPVINISIGGEISPGVYGEVQFGNTPPPPVLYAQPRIIVRHPPNMMVEPLYLHVPPGHARKWSRHCREYDACDRPVYFVKSREYEPGYRSYRDRKHRDEGRGDKDRRGEHSDEGRRGEGHRD